MIRRDIEKGLIRSDIDINLTAFWINSLYIILVTSLITNHFKVRLKEYLEIESDLADPAIEDLIRRTTEMIHRLLKPALA